MEKNGLRAIVIGAGWAGEGHVKALQYSGVEVVAICARQIDVVQKVAANLGVANASIDWQQSLQTLKPDIVALATPAVLRGEVVELATNLGCHLLCDKPLATTAEEAHRLYTIAAQAKIKHAYAATHRYDPSTSWVAELLAKQTIGQLQEIDLSLKVPYMKASTPWGWMDSLAQGGGLLNNGLPHFLSVLEKMLAGKLQAVVGEARVIRKKAYYVPDIHDYRHFLSKEVTATEGAEFAWRDCDADNAFSALLQFETKLAGNEATLPVMMRMNMVAPAPAPTNGWYFYGDKGTLVGEGFFSLSLTKHIGSEREFLPTPQRLLDELPQVGDGVQSKWNALVRDFMADIRNEPHDPYLTFEDGWRYQAAIDAIREGKNWWDLPS